MVYLALLALAAGRALHAQTGLTGASLQGSVRDGAGAGLAEALVTLVFEGTGIARTTSTDAEGRYTFPALAVGTYRLRVAAPGFRTWEREGLLAAVGRALVVDVGLVLAASEAVTVHRESTADGNQGAAVAALAEAQAIDGLPANGRNFVAFSLLSPAVVSERTPPTGPTASSGLSFAGQRARSNHVMVDGFDNDDAFTGAVAAVFSQEAVREFQVLAASAPAEFGHAAGGTVNTVTKSGSNDWHGSAFFFLRDRTLNAKEHFEKVDVFGSPVDAPKGPFHQAQWGATLGGPLRKDRTFAFLSFERRSLDATNFVTIDPGVAASLEAAGFQIALGSVPYAQGTWSALAKVDHTFTPNHRVTLRGHLSDRSDENIEPFGGIVARSHGAVQLRRDFGVAVAATDVFSSGWVNEGRLQLVDGDQDIYGLDPACGGPCRDVHQGGPEVTLPGLAVAGRQLNTPQLRGNLDLQLADTLTRSTGRHTLKAGFDLDLIWRDGALSQDFGGRYVFTALRAIPGLVSRPLSALEAFDQGLPALYFQGYGGTTASGTTHLYSVFAQDRFRVRPWLTLEAGLRYQRYALGLAPVTVSDLDGTTLDLRSPGPRRSGSSRVRHRRPERPGPHHPTRLLRAVPRGPAPAHGTRDRDRERTEPAAPAREPAPVRRSLAIARASPPRACVPVPERRPGRGSGPRRGPGPAALGGIHPGAGARASLSASMPFRSADTGCSASWTTTRSCPRWARGAAPTMAPAEQGPPARSISS